MGLFEAGTMLYENLDGYAFKEKWEETEGSELLDVRTPAEYNSGTIKGAKNIDLMSPSFKDQILKLDKSKAYFIVCRSGGRSSQACIWMANEGFKVHNLAGGIGAWPR